MVIFIINYILFKTIITNLPHQSFQTDESKQLYAMRWEIETSFYELKYAIGLTCFHSKKVAYIKQDIYAHINDCIQDVIILKYLPLNRNNILADKSYGTNEIMQYIKSQKSNFTILPKTNTNKP